jgi:hypothetical protein
MQKEMPTASKKRVWVTPELEVIDIRATADGEVQTIPEGPFGEYNPSGN